MEITNLRPLSALSPGATEFELPAVVRIESSAKTGKYSSGRRQASARPDDDTVEISGEKIPEPSAQTAELPSDSQINLFA